MKKLLFGCVLISILTSFGYAQKTKLENYQKGQINLEDGSNMNVYVYFNWEYADEFQNSVSYITEDQYKRFESGEKFKSKEITELKVKKVKTYTLENGKKFSKVKFADLTAASAASFPKFYLFEIVAEGKINLYKKYVNLGAVRVGDLALLDDQGEIDYVNSTYACLIQKGNENAKDLVTVKIQEYVEDNKDVLSKLEAGEYGEINSVFGSKMGTNAVDCTKYIDGLINMVNDYNK
ncbi:MAG: hypothetical protein PWP52_2201 [Bacteroidales bacterium]|nr:hypothetical protein [Bacteroidales bacterium]